MPTTTISTSLLESVNIVLANLGESPVNTLSGDALPQQVSLALNTIEEVSTDIQSKGWWFNQQTASAYDTAANVVIYPSNTANEWSSSIPEEVRRYITIRSSRIAQTRLIGSEELQKFSYNEELVSLAILQQAHVRNSNGVLDFNDFPAELKGLGIDEVMFLQGSVEEKLGTLRLGGELATIAKTKAETSLLADQEELVTQQALTETEETVKRTAEKDLLLAQELKTDSEKDLIDAQKTQLIDQTIIEATAEKAFYNDGGVSIGGSVKSYRDLAAEMRMMGIQEAAFQATPAYKKVELLKDAHKLRESSSISGGSSTINTTVVGTKNGNNVTVEFIETAEVNSILSLMGEERVSSFTDNALASEALLMLRNTSRELQGRGLWFNTEYDTELTPDSSTKKISLASNVLSVEPNDQNILVYLHSDVGTDDRFLYNVKDKGLTFDSAFKAKVIYERGLHDIPQKYLEYVVIRTTMILVEMYPKSGVDIQRLVKLEQEAETYFRDREADQANYSVFDNYDAASRIGINRNYDLS